MFYELMLLIRDEEGTAMLIKHFNADFSAWAENEEHARFRLISARPNEAMFYGLTLSRRGAELEVFLSLNQDGVRRAKRFDSGRRLTPGAGPVGVVVRPDRRSRRGERARALRE